MCNLFSLDECFSNEILDTKLSHKETYKSILKRKHSGIWYKDPKVPNNFTVLLFSNALRNCVEE